jgi:hypothetical protein
LGPNSTSCHYLVFKDQEAPPSLMAFRFPL